MSTSIIWDNPGLALLGVFLVVFLILLFPILGALRRSREERERETLRVREPIIRGDRYRDDYRERPDHRGSFDEYDDEPPVDRWASRDVRDEDLPADDIAPWPSQRRSAGSRGPVRSIWFVLGMCVGAGALALWGNLPSAGTLTTILAYFDRPDQPSVTEQSSSPAGTNAQDRFATSDPSSPAAPAVIGGGDEIGILVDGFVTNLKAQLPMSVGPGITMVSVDSQANSVALGFTIAQSVADEDAPKLQNELENRFGASVCATAPDPTNIHGLNDRGVAFIITYVDLLGKKVAGLTVAPNFCPNPT